jgi:hypothetical protein
MSASNVNLYPAVPPLRSPSPTSFYRQHYPARVMEDLYDGPQTEKASKGLSQRFKPSGRRLEAGFRNLFHGNWTKHIVLSAAAFVPLLLAGIVIHPLLLLAPLTLPLFRVIHAMKGFVNPGKYLKPKD